MFLLGSDLIGLWRFRRQLKKIYQKKSVVKRMSSFLINKNLSLYYWLKKRIGKRVAFWVANSAEKVVLIFGREQVKDREW